MATPLELIWLLRRVNLGLLLSLFILQYDIQFLAPAVTVGDTEGAMDSTSVFFWPLLLPITL